MTDPRTELDRIQGLADAATEGPWDTAWEDGYSWVACLSAAGERGGGPVVTAPDSAWGSEKYDAEFIADARTSVPRLVQALGDVLTTLDYIEQIGTPEVQAAVRGGREAITEALDKPTNL